MGKVLLLLVLAAAVAAVVVVIRRSSGRRPRPAAPQSAIPLDPLRSEQGRSDPRRITVGDVVLHEGRDYIVRGSLHFDQDGFSWQEHFLDDLSVKRWLSVEDDEGLEIVLWESLRGSELQPGETTITHAGTTFTLDEHGKASFTAHGTTGTGPSGRVEYYDYASGEERLSFERYGEGDWEVGVGHVVGEYQLDVYPGSD